MTYFDSKNIILILFSDWLIWTKKEALKHQMGQYSDKEMMPSSSKKESREQAFLAFHKHRLFDSREGLFSLVV